MDQETETLQKGYSGNHVHQRLVQRGHMDQKVFEIRVGQDAPGMQETHHRGQNLGKNPGGGLEPTGTVLGAYRKLQELLRSVSHRNMLLGVLKIDLCHEIPRRDQQNHLAQSGHPKI
ncbi:hypothetical protein NDU88_001736 [Pleurodeles waltl]|uniref:Uncharacterized protein n=1 Tax=Pleurodeles waltl TaxID=8319 RepID=A0AAV7Q6W5_PLEWA|nr:hypothetical protein NDU88_001736 [Pleurodeles waltl]